MFFLGNGIYDSGANAFLECLEVNKTLYDIYFRGNVFSPFLLNKIMKLQGENKKRMTEPQTSIFTSISRVFSRSKIEKKPDDEHEKKGPEASEGTPVAVTAASSSLPPRLALPPPPSVEAASKLESSDSPAPPKTPSPAMNSSLAPSPAIHASNNSCNDNNGDIVKIPRTKEEFEAATVEDVAEWLRVVVKLDSDVCGLARKNKIRGKTLWGMTRRDFTECGFAFGDATAIVEELSKVKEISRTQAKRSMGFAADPNSDAERFTSSRGPGEEWRSCSSGGSGGCDDDDDDGNEKDGFALLDNEDNSGCDNEDGAARGAAQKAGKYCNRDDVSVVYKGKLGLSEDYVPEESCVDAILKHEDALAERIPFISSIVRDCQVSMDSIKSGPAAGELIEKYDLNDDEVFALVLYTYDIGMRGPSTQNFYYVLNETLRARSVNKQTNNN